MGNLHKSEVNRILGFPDDARLLIINADDFGMCHAINTGILQAFGAGLVQSTSLMTPCPWALHAINILKENPDISFGVHLTLICEMVNYKWGSLTSREKVPSLHDETGYFYHDDRMSEFLAVVKLDEIEIEYRAQIEMVLETGLKPTHLDWHCLSDGGRADMLDLKLGLAKEYGLAMRGNGQVHVDRLLDQGLPVNEHDTLDSFLIDPATKPSQYAQMLRELPIGLSEWAVHPAIENDELLTIEPTGNHVRQTDLDFLISSEAREIIEQEGIILLSYEPLQKIWQQ